MGKIERDKIDINWPLDAIAIQAGLTEGERQELDDKWFWVPGATDESLAKAIELYKKTPDVVAAKAYSTNRLAAYKPITEQLDMLFHDLENGSSKWVDHIKEVKAKFPKPN